MPDYRKVRGERSRSAIMVATQALMMNGNWQPSAPQIADAAGVSIRTIFGYFKGIENLRLLAIEDEEVVWGIAGAVLNCSHDLGVEAVRRMVRAIVLGRLPLEPTIEPAGPPLVTRW